MVTALLKYQDLDLKKRAIVNELNSTEEFKRAKKARSYLKEAEEGLKSMDARQQELNSVLEKLMKTHESAKETLADYEQVVDTCEDMDELSYLSKKTTQLSRQLEMQEKEINKIVEEIESMLNTYNGYKTNVPLYKAEYKENGAKYEERKKERSNEIEDLERQMQRIEKDIKPKILEAYKKLSKEGRIPCLVKLVEGNKCGGCNVDIPIGSVARLEDGVILCENCRRMIYKE